jgi:hypothetical protein
MNCNLSGTKKSSLITQNDFAGDDVDFYGFLKELLSA